MAHRHRIYARKEQALSYHSRYLLAMVDSKPPFIRAYKPEDYDFIVNIVTLSPPLLVDILLTTGLHKCELTAHHTLSNVVKLVPYLYAHPYLRLEPEHIWVLDVPSKDGIGRDVTGYILSVADTRRFVQRYATEYMPLLEPDGELPLPPELHNQPAASGLRTGAKNAGRLLVLPEELLERYPAHLHVDIVEPWQGKGWGPKLMVEMESQLAQEGVKGVHLGAAADNTRAVSFYKRIGFEEITERVGTAGVGGRWFCRAVSKQRLNCFVLGSVRS